MGASAGLTPFRSRSLVTKGLSLCVPTSNAMQTCSCSTDSWSHCFRMEGMHEPVGTKPLRSCLRRRAENSNWFETRSFLIPHDYRWSFACTNTTPTKCQSALLEPHAPGLSVVAGAQRRVTAPLRAHHVVPRGLALAQSETPRTQAWSRTPTIAGAHCCINRKTRLRCTCSAERRHRFPKP